MIMTVLFVCASWREIGLGHLKRCLSLANYSKDKGMKPALLVLGEEGTNNIIRKTSIEYKLVPYRGIIEFDNMTSHLSEKKYDLIVFDMSFPDLFDQKPKRLNSLLKSLKLSSSCLMAIDGLGRYSLLQQEMISDIDILVTPYICRLKQSKSNSLIHLHGSQYALLSDEYANLPLRRVASVASNLLITCGGSDPTETTLLAIKAASRIKKALDIRVVIGPLFSKSLEMRVRGINKIDHFCELVQKPNSLREHILWCDIAISASGLTKYELAATSTPSIIFSIDSYHDDVNSIFANAKTSINLGNNPSENSFKEALYILINDKSLRLKLAQAGRNLIDLKGPSRLFEAALSFIEQSRKR